MSSMPDHKILRRCLWLAALLISACGHTPGPKDIPPDVDFATTILDDDTKLFTYSVRINRGGPDGLGSQRPPGRGEGGEQKQQRRPSARASQKGVEAMLMQNGYCRDGYVVLEQYEERTKYIVRGECRDAANDQDRARFKH
jgi:hypothetical protein